MILLSARFGKLADEHGPKLFLTVGPTLIAVGMVLFSLMRSKEDFWRAGVPGLLVFAFGLAMVVAPITSTALGSAPGQFSGVAAGLNQTFSRLGNLLAVAALGLVVLLVYHANGGDRGVPIARDQHDAVLRSASMDAFRVAMLVSAGLALAGAIVGAFGISNRDALRRSDQAEAAAAS
jgi:MFS family permease